jgi:hypothetical protein
MTRKKNRRNRRKNLTQPKSFRAIVSNSARFAATSALCFEQGYIVELAAYRANRVGRREPSPSYDNSINYDHNQLWY